MQCFIAEAAGRCFVNPCILLPMDLAVFPPFDGLQRDIIGIILAPVVHDDQLVIGEGLRQNAPDSFGHVGGFVIKRYNDGESHEMKNYMNTFKILSSIWTVFLSALG